MEAHPGKEAAMNRLVSRAGGTDRRFFRAAALATALVAVVLVLTACNTVEGFGRDMESVGQAIAELAD
jgi:predicted small secreted protein